MTSARQPHQQRCGTCYYPHEMDDATGKWKRCPIAKCELSYERLSLIDIVGCASHKAPHTSPPAPSKCQICVLTPGSCLSQHDAQVAKAARKDERNRLVDEFAKKFRSAYLFFDDVKFDATIESLRTQPEPQQQGVSK